MKNILLLISAIFVFSACKGQDKEEKNNTKENTELKIYSAKCQDTYSTGEKTLEKEKKWTLSNKDIADILKLSTEITENEWHYSYPVTPCEIEVNNYFYKNKKYDLKINGGSYISLYDGQSTIIFGCDSPECTKYFLKPKESMEEEAGMDASKFTNESARRFFIDFDKNAIPDSLTITKEIGKAILEAELNHKKFFNKIFYCDSINIETNTKYNQAFNLILGYEDQYQKTFRKIVIPVFYKNNNLFVQKIFIATLGINAKSGKEDWNNKEIKHRSLLQNIDIDSITSY